MKKALFEKIIPEEGSSFLMFHNKYKEWNQVSFWHFHPEYEIVYIPFGSGKRYIGTTISKFKDGDLILLGSNIPHNTFSWGFESEEFEEYIIQFSGDQIINMSMQYHEFGTIHELLDKAKEGVVFLDTTKHDIGSMIKAMRTLPPFEKLLQLFQVLKKMSGSTGQEGVNARQYLSVSVANAERVQKVYTIIQEKYDTPLSTKEIAATIGMTDSSFCRFFVNSTGKTFKKAVTEVRIQHACRLLATTNMPIAIIAIDCGFNSISLFNRFFKELNLESPIAYRKRFLDNIIV